MPQDLCFFYYFNILDIAYISVKSGDKPCFYTFRPKNATIKRLSQFQIYNNEGVNLLTVTLNQIILGSQV